MDDFGNVLVFGDDMRVFLAVVRAFGRSGKTVHVAPFDRRAPALKSKFVSKVHPLPNYSSDPPAWLEAVKIILTEHRIDLAVPCTDPAIIMLDRHRDELAGFRLAIPGREAMQHLFDKELTHDLCDRLGVPVSPARRLAQSATAQDLIAEFGLPLVIKPRKSYWLDQLDSWGRVHIIETAIELQKVLGGIADHERYLVEAYFEGQGRGISVLADGGRVLQAFQHRRLREGKGGSSSYRVSETPHPGMLAACEKICAAMRHTGVCMFEFRLNDRTGAWVLLETNARFWGSMPLPLALGLDYPNLLYDLMVRGLRHPPIAYRPGIKSRNFLLDGFNLLRQSRQLGTGGLAPWLAGVGDFCLQPWRWATGRESSDSFVIDDAAPGFWEVLTVLKLR